MFFGGDDGQDGDIFLYNDLTEGIWVFRKSVL